MTDHTYFSTDQFDILVSLEEAHTFFQNQRFSRMTGGDVDSAPQTVHPGGMFPAVVTRSRRTTSDITVTKPFEFGDHGRIFNLIDQGLVGTARVNVHKKPLDANRNPKGIGFSYWGILKSITQPEHDADSTDQTYWSLVITPEETLGFINPPNGSRDA